MNIKIAESGQHEVLRITDETGVNWVQDLIGNTGALHDGQFTWSDENDAYLTNQATYDWWAKYIAGCNATDAEIDTLASELDISANIIWRRIQEATNDHDYDSHRPTALNVMAQIREEYTESKS